MVARIWSAVAFVLLLALLPAATPTAQGTRREAIQMVDRAVAYYEANGIEALSTAVMDPENTAFHDRDLYVFIIDQDGQFKAHGANPRLIGHDLSKLKDQNGVYFIREFIETGEAKGQGWVEYLWLNPTTHKLQPKATLVKKIDTGLYLGVGIYQTAN